VRRPERPEFAARAWAYGSTSGLASGELSIRHDGSVAPWAVVPVIDGSMSLSLAYDRAAGRGGRESATVLVIYAFFVLFLAFDVATLSIVS